MKFTRVLFIVAAIILGVWLLGLLLKLAAWFISSLLYIAAIIVIVGIVHMYLTNRKQQKDATKNPPKN